MTLRLNQIAPDFTQNSTEGPIHFHEWLGNSWGVLFSHPKDFTPVCTTELGTVANLKPEFDKRNVKVIGLSVDSVDDHQRWSGDIKDVQGTAPNFPMLADADYKVSKLYDMLPESVSGDPSKRTPADNLTVRNVIVIGPDKKIRLILVYPMATGRNFEEILRVIDSMQLGDKHKIATPANWKPGDDIIISGAVSNDEAQQKFPGFKTVKPYLRTAAQPR
jgi:alkyl hydroperoxide reductase subunit AhpC